MKKAVYCIVRTDAQAEETVERQANAEDISATGEADV